ncbi:MAG: DNA-directed RNA polymerase subunit beta [Planctomycetota bacterium]
METGRMKSRTIRNFGKIDDATEVPDLTEVQLDSYGRFIQLDAALNKRKDAGLEALFREIFPIVSYDKTMELEYLGYELEKPRYTLDQCRELRLTYGYPLKVHCRLKRQDADDIAEQAIYLGEMPVMIGGGEFIINGAERVIVNQLHRSPGVDFGIDSKDGDRVLHGARIIPERGSWIEISVTKKDVMVIRIDQSSKIPATTFLRAMDEKYGKTEDLIRLFYETKKVKVKKLDPAMWSVGPIVDTETGEILVEAGAMLGDAVASIQASELESVEVVVNATDTLILTTLAEDKTDSHKEALMKIYSRLRPGNPAQADKAKTLFEEKFYDTNRYRLGKVGRFRLNRKFGTDVGLDEMALCAEDFLRTMKYVLGLRNNEGEIDDIDHLGNRRLRTIDELAAGEIRKGLLKLRRTVQERMSMKAPEDITRVADLVNSKSVSSSIDFFFGRGELSQVVDQTNALSQLTHERRLSALGPGGLNRKRAGFEVRDVHLSHYGRVCPIETPEGTNIGLIVSLGLFSKVDEYGFLVTPYRKVKNKKLQDEIVHLRADEEMNAIFAPPSMIDVEKKKLRDGLVLARREADLTQCDSSEVNYVDVSPRQTVGISAALIPFLEHDDANRALMGSNMQRQSVPLLNTERPLVGTGMEMEVAANSSMVAKARKSGTITAVDSTRIVIDQTDEYLLEKFVGLNERTCLNQKPIVELGQKVKKGQVIADGGGTDQGCLALGKNILVAFVPFDGYNFEDAILLSEKLVKEDAFTSIHIDEFSVEVRETKLGREEFTCDIPNVSEKALRNLDERGIVREGTRVGPDDILVGKVSPKSKTELTPEEKLLHAIFGRAGEDVKNDSLEVPSGYEGVVIKTRHFKRRAAETDEERKALKEKMRQVEANIVAKECDVFRQMMNKIHDTLNIEVVDPATRQKAGASEDNDVLYEQIEEFDIAWVKPAKVRSDAQKIVDTYWPKIIDLQEEKKQQLDSMKHGDELSSGVLEMVKIYVATKRTLSIGDKMAGRHGNKGVIAKILPEEDMPFLEDGTPVDICLNPLGVPSRMNVGQILETHLGWAGKVLGFDAVTPVFAGATEQDIFDVTEEANAHVRSRIAELQDKKEVPPADELFAQIPPELKTRLYDGRTGEPFDQNVTIGYIYMLKLHHLVDEKIHARSTGPYSLITQQPLGGKARTGGQRFGEMEVWALEAYGAAYTLQELLTVKSDDIEGRTKIYESMVKGTNTLEAGTPISFDVLCNEIRGLGLNIQLEKKRIGSTPL